MNIRLLPSVTDNQMHLQLFPVIMSIIMVVFLQCFESEKKLIIFSEVTDTKAKHLNYAQYKIPQPPTNKCSHCSKMHITFKSV